MIGVEFECTNKYGRILKDLLENILIESYDWYIYDDEIMTDDYNLTFPEFMNSKDFNEIVSDSPYYVCFANVQVYPKCIPHSKLITYEDFMASNYEFVNLIADVVFVEIYAKSKSIIMQFIENAKSINCKKY